MPLFDLSAAAGWAPNLKLINAGGTALSGSATVNITGLSTYSILYIQVDGASGPTTDNEIIMRVNNDQGGIYKISGITVTTTTWSTAMGDETRLCDTWSTNAANTVNMRAIILGSNQTGYKPAWSSGVLSATSTRQNPIRMGAITTTSAISQVNMYCTNGNFDGGTIYVYGA